MMTVLYVTATFPFGKGESFIWPELQALINLGHKVVIVPRSTSDPLLHDNFGEMLGYTVSQPLLSVAILVAFARALLCCPRKIVKGLWIMFHSRPLFTLLKNLIVFPKGVWVGSVARKYGVDHIHAHWALTTSTIAMVASIVSDIPWSFTAHRSDIVCNNLLAVKARRASFARFISESGYRMAISQGVSPSPNVAILHMGVLVPDVPSEIRSIPTGNNLRLLCPANLYPVKGHTYLIHALNLLRLRGVQPDLWIAGDGSMHATLKQQVQQLGLTDQIKFWGQMSNGWILDRYRQGDVDAVVLPSVDLGNGEHEGIPVSLMEAMSFALPVISTTTGGIPELIGNGAGILVPPFDPDALADAIMQLTIPDIRRRFGLAGRKRIEELFSVSLVAEQLACRFSANSSGSWIVKQD